MYVWHLQLSLRSLFPPYSDIMSSVSCVWMCVRFIYDAAICCFALIDVGEDKLFQNLKDKNMLEEKLFLASKKYLLICN